MWKSQANHLLNTVYLYEDMLKINFYVHCSKISFPQYEGCTSICPTINILLEQLEKNSCPHFPLIFSCSRELKGYNQ